LTDTPELAELVAKLASIHRRIDRDREHSRQIGDDKVREEVEAYIKGLEKTAEELAAQIAVLKSVANDALPDDEQDIAALKPPPEPDQEG
jgi:hypothetical protein